MQASFHDERAVLCQYAFAVDQRVLDQLRGAQITVQGRVGGNALLVERNVKRRGHGRTPVKSVVRI